MDFSRLIPLGSQQIAIDLGTANTLVFLPGQGIVIDEPSVVALEAVNGVQRIRAVGSDAKILMGKTPDNIRTYRPLNDGVINDLDVAEAMIKHFIEKATGGRSLMSRGPEIVIGVPSAATQVERRAIRTAAFNAGAHDVWLIEEPMAAAIGAGLPVDEPIGSMVVDIGGGTTEVGIISLKRPTYSTSARVGGDKMDDAITSYVRRKHNVLIGPTTAERIKKEIGSALASPEGMHVLGFVGGLGVAHGNPCEIALSQAEIAEALSEPVQQIVELVASSLEHAGPEIAADIIDCGICMTGGGALLRGIDTVLSDEIGLPVTVAAEPLRCVALGAGRALEDPEYRTEFAAA
jgi:rod shape-determining protein MreB and related proteins